MGLVDVQKVLTLWLRSDSHVVLNCFPAPDHPEGSVVSSEMLG